ncbi:MAG: hypothetical protein MHM6MM_005697 [Cercozoa sp. M6MM]
MGSESKSASYDYLFKVVLVGDPGVGKSCLVLRFADQSFNTKHVSTIGVDFRFRIMPKGEHTVKLQIWDTAGHERFRTLTTSYFRRGAHGIILVYDIADETSFSHIGMWLDEIKRHSDPGSKLPLLLIGNKTDLGKRREVSTEQALEFATQHGMMFVEVSAKSDHNVDEAFDELVNRMTEIAGPPRYVSADDGTVKLRDSSQSSSCC